MRWTRWTAAGASLAALAATVVTLSCATQQQQQNPPAEMTQQQKIERGEYLTWLGGCNDCHTPGTFYGAPDMERRFSGSEVGWTGPWGTTYPRNITPDSATGIGTWSEDDIVKALRTGQRADGTEILPPMPWPMYAHLTDEDAYAIAAYLKSIPPVSHRVPDKLAPGRKAPTALLFPPPPAWDAPRTPPAGAAPDTSGH